jgi:hypothetical protein
VFSTLRRVQPRNIFTQVSFSASSLVNISVSYQLYVHQGYFITSHLPLLLSLWTWPATRLGRAKLTPDLISCELWTRMLCTLTKGAMWRGGSVDFSGWGQPTHGVYRRSLILSGIPTQPYLDSFRVGLAKLPYCL